MRRGVVDAFALRAFLVLVAALVIGGASVAVRGIRLDTSLADIVPSADGSLERRARESGTRTLRFVLRSSDGAALGTATATLARALDAIPDVRRDDDPTLLERRVRALVPQRFSLLPDAARARIDAGESDLLVEDAIDALYAPGGDLRPLAFDRDPLNLFGGWVAEHLRFDPRGDGDVRAVSATRLDIGDEAMPDDALEAALEAAIAATKASAPNVELHRTGVFFFSQAAATASKRDIDRISIGSTIGILALLLPVFRSFWPLMLPALSVAVGAASAFVLVALVYERVHVLTLVFGASLIGIVVDYSIHGHAHGVARGVGLDGMRRRGLDPRLVRALALSLATSVLGYAALSLSSLDALRKVALFSVAGIAGAWLTVVALLPLTAPAPGRARLAAPALVARALLAGARRAKAGRGARLALALVAVLACGFALFGSRADDDPRRLVELSPELVADAEAVARLAGGFEPSRHVVIEAPDLERLYAASATVRDRLRSEGVDSLSIVDLLPPPSLQAADRARYATLLEPGGAIEQALSAVGEEGALDALRAGFDAAGAGPIDVVGIFDDPALGLPPLVSALPGGDVATLLFVSAGGSVDALPGALARAVDGVSGARAIDVLEANAAALGGQRRSAFLVLAGAFAAIAVLLLLVYRDRAGLRLLLVPAGAVVGTLAALAVASVSLTLFHAVALFLVLGLGMDYAVFVEELGGGRASPVEAGAEGDARTGTQADTGHDATFAAIVLSAATSLLSFGLLATTDIPVARFFGQTAFVGSLLNLSLTFLLMAPGTGRTRRPGGGRPSSTTIKLN